MKTAVEELFNIWMENQTITPNEWSKAFGNEKKQKLEFATEYADNVMAGMTLNAEQFLEEYETFKQEE